MDTVGNLNRNYAYDKRKQRARKRKEGYVLKQIWVKPENWEELKKYIKGIDDGNK